jgi:hypothetical protein
MYQSKIRRKKQTNSQLKLEVATRADRKTSHESVKETLNTHRIQNLVV